jgi:hypothetical protein
MNQPKRIRIPRDIHEDLEEMKHHLNAEIEHRCHFEKGVPLQYGARVAMVKGLRCIERGHAVVAPLPELDLDEAVSITAHADLWRICRELSFQHTVTVSDVVRRALRLGLDDTLGIKL